jgi:hypothetical protein
MSLLRRIKRGIKKAVKAVTQAVKQVVSIVKEAVNRVVGVVDFIGSLIGIRLRKKLRLRIVILRDETGQPLVTEKELEPSLSEARRVYDKEVQTKILAAGGKLIVTLDEVAPAEALDVGCGTRAWGEDFGEAGDFFSRHSANNVGGFLIGYAAPVTVFIVHDVAGEGGCSLGPIVNYVTVDLGGLRGSTMRVLAHEVAHACGLWHSKSQDNLMFPNAPGEKLKGWQEAILRNSRHVTFV